jgi:hypothetical protein
MIPVVALQNPDRKWAVVSDLEELERLAVRAVGVQLQPRAAPAVTITRGLVLCSSCGYHLLLVLSLHGRPPAEPVMASTSSKVQAEK